MWNSPTNLSIKSLKDDILTLISGPFLQDPSCSRYADFTATIYMDYHSIIAPLALSPKPLGFLDPLNPWVWLATLVSIPIFIITMGLFEMLYHTGYRGYRIDWNSIVGFVLRVTTNQSSSELLKKGLPVHKKVLTLTWVLVFFVILVSYAGTRDRKRRLVVHYFLPGQSDAGPGIATWAFSSRAGRAWSLF